MDATMKRFNLEITNIRQMYTTVVLAMTSAGKFTRTPARGAKGAGAAEFQAAVASGDYAHVALLNVSDVAQEWHQEVVQIEPVKTIVKGFAVPNKIGVPIQLEHLDWQEDVYIPEPGKKIPFLRVTVQYEEDNDNVGETHVTVIATRFPRSFQVRIHVREIDGEPMDDIGVVSMGYSRLAFKGTVEEFEQDFDAIRRRVEKQVGEIVNRPTKSGSEWGASFDGWRNPPTEYNMGDFETEDK